MQKKLIALAVAGLMAAPMAASAANVEAYGKVRLSVDFTDNGDANTANEDSMMAVSSNSSRLGFKGSEDLGNGLTAKFQMEAEVNMDDGSDLTSGMRNTFVGLSGDFGEVRLGKHDTPYKMSTKDIFGDTRADYNGGSAKIGTVSAKTGPIRLDNRAGNVLAYISPDMNGFTFAGALVTDLDDDDLAATKNGNTDGVSLMGVYNAGPLGVSLAIETLGEASPYTPTGSSTVDDIEGTKFGVSYDIQEGTTVRFIFESVDYGTNGSAAMEQDAIYLSGSHKVGNGVTAKLAFGQLDDFGCTGCSDSGATYFAIGAGKEMGDTTELYALYTSHDPDKNAAVYGLSGVEGATGSGGDPETTTALSFGINMKFSSM